MDERVAADVSEQMSPHTIDGSVARLNVEPALHPGTDQHEGVLVWRWPRRVAALSSAPIGGGLRSTSWLINVGVPLSYGRTDLGQHCVEIARSTGLNGEGIALFTAADVTQRESASVGDVCVDATVGISKPTWAADSAGGWSHWEPGTINLVVQVDRPLEPGAAVNAVATATEAKTQALFEAKVPGTGTASDAVVILWPADRAGPAERFAGPRSPVGSEIAQAVHLAVQAGIARWLVNARQNPGSADLARIRRDPTG